MSVDSSVWAHAFGVEKPLCAISGRVQAETNMILFLTSFSKLV